MAFPRKAILRAAQRVGDEREVARLILARLSQPAMDWTSTSDRYALLNRVGFYRYEALQADHEATLQEQENDDELG